MPRFLVNFLSAQRGAVAIETAIVAPVLAMMAIGTFEVGTMVSRQQELQSAASEAEGIVLAAASGSGTDSDAIEEIIKDSLDPDGERANLEVSLEMRFRCDTAEELETAAATCDPDKPIYQYLLLDMSDRYTPVWTNYGFGDPFTYEVTRTIQIQ